MEPFNVTAEGIGANLTRLDELKSLQEQRKRETGDAQKATQERNEKFDQLKDWCSTLRELVKILFEEENAQYLEKLGILVRS